MAIIKEYDFRMCPMDGLKGQKAHSPGRCPGDNVRGKRPGRAKALFHAMITSYYIILLPLQGVGYAICYPGDALGCEFIAPSGRYRVVADNH